MIISKYRVWEVDTAIIFSFSENSLKKSDYTRRYKQSKSTIMMENAFHPSHRVCECPHHLKILTKMVFTIITAKNRFRMIRCVIYHSTKFLQVICFLKWFWSILLVSYPFCKNSLGIISTRLLLYEIKFPLFWYLDSSGKIIIQKMV